MAKGLRIPVGVDLRGGSATVEGDEYAKQVLAAGLTGHDNANAFEQESGLGEGMIFGINSTSLKASVLRRLYAMFDAWEAERLYRLMRETVAWSTATDGDLVLEFKFVNLETDVVESFKKKFLSGG
jgi:hypothetical protein